jgi:hypothetical protein
MTRDIPEKLLYFLKNALHDVDDGYEYSSELHRILNSDDCQRALKTIEIETLRVYAEKAKEIGEIDYYAEERLRAVELEVFGKRGIRGYLDAPHEASKAVWPF